MFILLTEYIIIKGLEMIKNKKIKFIIQILWTSP